MWKLLVTLIVAGVTTLTCSCMSLWQLHSRPLCTDVLDPVLRTVAKMGGCATVSAPQAVLLGHDLPTSMRLLLVCARERYYLQVMLEWDTELVNMTRKTKHIVLLECRMVGPEGEDIPYEINLVTLITRTMYAGGDVK